MSVLIKGKEMPKSCSDCPMLDWDLDYIKCKVTGRHFKVKEEPFRARRVDDCPLVPVPPHGRLIDADALDDAFTDLRWEKGDYRSGVLMHWGDRPNWCLKGNEVENLINAAPTIIEAEESE